MSFVHLYLVQYYDIDYDFRGQNKMYGIDNEKYISLFSGQKPVVITNK